MGDITVELFGVFVEQEKTLGEPNELLVQLERWNIGSSRDTAELILRLQESSATRIVVARTGTIAVRKAASLIASAVGEVIQYPLMHTDRRTVEVALPPAGADREAVLSRIGWALFLWAATQHPSAHRWESFWKSAAPKVDVAPVAEEPQPVVEVPPQPSPPRVVLPVRVAHSAVAYQSLPLSRPHAQPGVGPVRAPAPPAHKPRRG